MILPGINVVVASHASAISAADAKRLAAFVNGGGLLITTPWIASCSPHGNLLSVYPAEETGLASCLDLGCLTPASS